ENLEQIYFDAMEMVGFFTVGEIIQTIRNMQTPESKTILSILGWEENSSDPIAAFLSAAKTTRDHISHENSSEDNPDNSPEIEMCFNKDPEFFIQLSENIHSALASIGLDVEPLSMEGLGLENREVTPYSQNQLAWFNAASSK